MKLRTIAAGALAAALLTACAKHTDDGLADARRVCTALNAGRGVSPTADTTSEDPDWTKLADDLNGDADVAAAAARKDPRWDRLADSLNTLQRLVADVARTQGDDPTPQLAPDDRRQLAEAYDVLQSECRKARAT